MLNFFDEKKTFVWLFEIKKVVFLNLINLRSYSALFTFFVTESICDLQDSVLSSNLAWLQANSLLSGAKHTRRSQRILLAFSLRLTWDLVDQPRPLPAEQHLSIERGPHEPDQSEPEYKSVDRLHKKCGKCFFCDSVNAS